MNSLLETYLFKVYSFQEYLTPQVRQLFQERRGLSGQNHNPGWDKSYPLEPIPDNRRERGSSLDRNSNSVWRPPPIRRAKSQVCTLLSNIRVVLSWNNWFSLTKWPQLKGHDSTPFHPRFPIDIIFLHSICDYLPLQRLKRELIVMQEFARKGVSYFLNQLYKDFTCVLLVHWPELLFSFKPDLNHCGGTLNRFLNFV